MSERHTRLEREVIYATTLLARSFRRLETEEGESHPSHGRDVADAVHDVQRIIAMRLARRADPAAWREAPASATGWQPMDAPREPSPSPAPPPVDPPRIVAVDASWRDGYAGLGVAGALGSHFKGTTARTSTAAEAEALLFAMTLARGSEERPAPILFRTDCLIVAMLADGQRAGAAGMHGYVPQLRNLDEGWAVEHASGKQVRDAHVLARHALRTMIGRADAEG